MKIRTNRDGAPVRMAAVRCGLGIGFSAVLILAGCGGGPTLGPRMLTALSVQPTDAGASPGATFPFSATGTFDQAPLTQEKTPAHWASSDPSIATIDPSSGVARCVALGGPITVTATAAGKGGSVQNTAKLSCLASGTELTVDPGGMRFVCFPEVLGGCTCTTPQSSTLTNTWSETLFIDRIALNNEDFDQFNNCGASLGPGQSCTIQVGWSPTHCSTRGCGDGGGVEIDDSGGVHLLSLTASASCVP